MTNGIYGIEFLVCPLQGEIILCDRRPRALPSATVGVAFQASMQVYLLDGADVNVPVSYAGGHSRNRKSS
jgi:hypothetical protein